MTRLLWLDDETLGSLLEYGTETSWKMWSKTIEKKKREPLRTVET